MVALNETQASLPYEEQFLAILNNRGKQEKASGSPRRTRGFVVLARGATSLKPLQAACYNQNYNQCLTARYRLQSDAGLGTLWMAFLKDLEILIRGGNDFTGDLNSAGTPDDWGLFSRTYYARIHERLGSEVLDGGKASGVLDIKELSILLGSFDDEGSVLRTGQRLVLFGEFSEASTNLAEWETALGGLFNQLPERIGLVLAGAPEKFQLPAGDPHYLELVVPRTSAAPPETGTETVARYALSSLQSDLPAQKDELGVEPYAQAIARFILHPQTRAPLTIGIYGEWGKGKSSFMKLIDLELIKQADINAGQRRRETAGETRTQRLKDLQAVISRLESQVLGAKGEGKGPTAADVSSYKTARASHEILWRTMQKDAKREVITVTFNAWQFEDSKQIWAGLASQISKRIEEELPWIAQQWLRIKYAWKERRTELLMNVMLPVAVMCMVVGFFSVGYFRNIVVPAASDSSFGSLLRLLLPAGSALLTIWFLSSNILKVAKPMSERVLSYVSLPNYRDQMGFQHRVKDDLGFILKYLKSRRPKCKVVVYIDDLDRCSESKIMEILQAINLILAGSEFFVFVGMNMEIIERAIATYYKDKAVDDLADYYLSKIVQISFELPQHPDLDNYLSSLFSHQSRFELGVRLKSDTVAKDVGQAVAAVQSGRLSFDLNKVLKIVSSTTQEVEDTPDELKAFCDYSNYLENNPRKVLRLINTHRLIKILLQRDNTFWPVERQRKLVIWRIFCDRWPYLVHYAVSSGADHCLLDSIQRFQDMEKDKLEDPTIKYEIGTAKVFAGMMASEDRLSSSDIDEDFRRAADLMKRVH